jgi:hypothetical protein
VNLNIRRVTVTSLILQERNRPFQGEIARCSAYLAGNTDSILAAHTDIFLERVGGAYIRESGIVLSIGGLRRAYAIFDSQSEFEMFLLKAHTYVEAQGGKEWQGETNRAPVSYPMIRQGQVINFNDFSLPELQV